MNKAKVWMEKVMIPTYEIGEAERNPIFLDKRVYQGSCGKVYPYPAVEKISDEKRDKEYEAVFLENDYLKVMVLPQLGGRIQRAYDKTNGYDFVYYNHVIKPALVGLTGPWISGGIEFNWPQHHRPTTFLPVDWLLEEKEDGSCCVLLHDVDQMYGTKGLMKIALYPDKAYIEITGQLYNRTSLPQTFLWWANPAVAVNDNTQSIFPPDVHAVMDHGKRDVSRFPIATGVYYKKDYSEGVDISRYKNIPVPTSYMAEKSKYDFVGGYDYGVEAGVLHVADHHVSPGKKQWTWGCGDFGKAWDRNLTDEDGPYIELMTGMFTDNQPDFSWLKPFEEKTFTQYFMPYKALGQVMNATKEAALHLSLEKGKVRAAVYASSVYEEAEVILTKGEEIILKEKVKLSPEDVFERIIPVENGKEEKLHPAANGEERELNPAASGKERELNPTVNGEERELNPTANGKEEELHLAVYAGGVCLAEYRPEAPEITRMPEPAQAAEEPSRIQTCEELYLTGQHIEQYRHATYQPDPYYLEGLKRDPGDIRINNAYGALLMRRGQFTKAEKYFRKALERLTWKNPNPYNSETYYLLGLDLLYQERKAEAYDAFYKASWSSEQQEMSFYYLGVISSGEGKYDRALAFTEKALVKNAHNIKARGLKAYLLRKLGKTEQAGLWVQENLTLDPFDYVSCYEEVLLAAAEAPASERISALEGISEGRSGKPASERLSEETSGRPASERLSGETSGRPGSERLSGETSGRPASERLSGETSGRPGSERLSGETSDQSVSELLIQMNRKMRQFPENYLMTARDYAEFGAYEEAAAVLRECEKEYPLLTYYEAYYRSRAGESADKLLEKAEGQCPDYCFPNKLEDIAVLNFAIKQGYTAKAAYYLGNLFYDRQQWEEALALWECSAGADDTFPTVFRNLALIYYNKRQDPEKARAALEKAFSLNPADPRVFLELDQLYRKLGRTFEERLASHEAHKELVGARDDLYIEYITLLNMCGEYRKAYQCIMGRKFHPWEGGEGKITAQYTIALLEMARQALEEEKAEEAEELLRRALVYPENLGEGKLEGTKDNHLYYHLGLALEAQGKKEEANQCFEKASVGTDEPAGAMYYNDQPADMILYQGLSHRKLDRKREACSRFYRLLDYGERHLKDKVKIEYFAVSLPEFMIFDEDYTARNRAHCYYLMALGNIGLGNREKAADFLKKAAEIEPSHMMCRIYGKHLQE